MNHLESHLGAGALTRRSGVSLLLCELTLAAQTRHLRPREELNDQADFPARA
jgi:hypothetical protein